MHLYVEPGLDHFNMLQPPGLFFLLRSRTDEFHSTLVVVSLPVAVSGPVYFASCFYVQRGACKNPQKVYKFTITSIWLQWHVPGVNTCPNNNTETIMGKNHNQKMNMSIIPAQLVGSRFCFWHHLLMLTSQKFQSNGLSTFLSQSVLFPSSTFAFAMSPSPTRWSHCARLSLECRMVSQILTSRLFEGRSCWSAMESSNPWCWYKLLGI